jgi:hypothetical protein
VAPPPLEQEPAVPETPAPIIVSSTHPGFFDDFEGGDRGWSTYGQQSGVARIVASQRPAGGHCLEVANPGVGGLFETIAPIKDCGINAANVRRISFDYCLDPGVHVNLYVRTGDQYYYVHMNGPDEPSPFYLRLGELAVEADGRWHRAEFPLGAALRSLGMGGRVITLAIGNLHRGALQMGLGGNGAGLAYRLDDFEVVSGGRADFRAVCRTSDVPEGAAVLGAVDEGTMPAQAKPLEFKGVEPGLHACHARVKFQDGYAGPPARLPFLVTTAPLRMTATAPPAGGKWGYCPIEIELGSPDSAWLAPGSLALSVNGAPVPQHPGLFRVDWVGRRLYVDLAASGLELPDGQAVELSLTYSDEWNNKGSFATRYVASGGHDRTPPTRVVLVDQRPTDDFEDDLGGWQPGERVALMRDDTTAASGRYSLMVQNHRWRGTFQAFPFKEHISLGSFPLVEFDYKIAPGVPVDLLASSVLGQITVGMSDRSLYRQYLGAMPDFQADDKWHHAEYNLLQGVKKLGYRRNLYTCNWMAMGDTGYCCSALGAFYHIDNFRLVPLVGGARQVQLSWSSHDAAGIAGYSYKWSADREDAPDDEVDTAEPCGTFVDVPSPDAYFHVKAMDKNGNWGPVEHFRFRADGTAPRVAKVSPADGQRAAPANLTVVIRDAESAVNPDTLKVTIDGRTYGPDSVGVSYNPAGGTFTWDWLQARPKTQRSIANGKTVKMALAAEDFAGNALPPQHWSWVMDYSRDKTPPGAPVLGCHSLLVRWTNDFQDGTGQWRSGPAGRGSAATQLNRVVRDKGKGDYCLELTTPQANGQFDAVAVSGRYDLVRFPHLSLDCQIPPPVKINMQVQINGRWHSFKLTGPKYRYTLLGEANGLKTDGSWQRVSLNLLDLARKAMPDTRAFSVNSITFGDPARNGNQGGLKWRVDDFLVSNFGQNRASFTWRVDDISGIKGYAAVLDTSRTTVPPPKITTTNEKGFFDAWAGGTLWLHVRACDGNGNWSDTSHFIYPVTAPDAPAPPPASQPQ